MMLPTRSSGKPIKSHSAAASCALDWGSPALKCQQDRTRRDSASKNLRRCSRVSPAACPVSGRRSLNRALLMTRPSPLRLPAAP